jgi:hypothetical protein
MIFMSIGPSNVDATQVIDIFVCNPIRALFADAVSERALMSTLVIGCRRLAEPPAAIAIRL